MNDPGPQVVVVYDDDREAEMIVLALRAEGYRVCRARDSLDGLIAVEQIAPAVIVLKWEMPFIDGEIFTHAVRTGLAKPPPVVVCGGSREDPRREPDAGVRLWLTGPLDTATLTRAVRSLITSSPG